MRVYLISIYDNNWNLVSRDFSYCEDRQQAELKAEKDADWLGCEHWEIQRVR